jgi:hypothetical protein
MVYNNNFWIKNIIMKLLTILILSLFLISCGGGGGSATSANTGTAELSQDIVVQEDLSVIESITSSNAQSGEVVFADVAKLPTDWKADKVVLFPPSDAISQGMAIKIDSISTATGKAKISYTTPSIDELFTSMDSNNTQDLTTSMVKSFNAVPGVSMSANIRPEKTFLDYVSFSSSSSSNNNELEWFPSFGKFSREAKATDDNYIKSLNFALKDVVIVQNKDKTQKLSLSGGLKFKDLKIHNKFVLDRNFNGTPNLDTLQFGAQIDYTLEKSFEINSNLDVIKANMATIPGIKEDFSCAGGNIQKVNVGPVKVEITGANWPKTDVCLGAVSISMAGGIAVKKGNGGIMNLSPSIDLYLIMGMDFNLSLKTKWSFKKTTENKLGVWLDKTKKDNQLTLVNESIETSKENLIQGSINGSLGFDKGLAIALNIMNIKPAVARVFATLDLKGSGNIIYDNVNTNDSLTCLKGDLQVGLAGSFHIGVSAKLTLMTTWAKGKSFGAGSSYDKDFNGDAFVKFKYDGCKTENLDFDIVQNNENITINNILLKNANSTTTTIKENSITWKIYKRAPFTLVKTITTNNVNIDDLDYGEYVAILTLQNENDLELTKIKEFSKIVSTPAGLVTTAGDSQINLKWNATSGATYNLYYAKESFAEIDNISNYASLSGGTLLNNLSVNDKTIANLTNNTKYYFVITAVKNNVESGKSNEMSVMPVVPTTPNTATSTLNDTGITWGGDYPSGNNATCTGENISAQDCSHGRDKTHNDDSDGHAGFSFTKLSSSGAELPASATNWSCVKDNVTGLIWEVKTTGGSIHDKDNTYRWGGKTAIGREYPSREGNYYDDWNTFVDRVNDNSFCGFNDWRVPTSEELRSIVHYGKTNPAIDSNYFPNTASYFWSASPYAYNSNFALQLNSNNGDNYTDGRYNYGRVRLVRNVGNTVGTISGGAKEGSGGTL